MSYTNAFKIANGMILDFTVQSATPASDDLLFVNSDGEVVKASSIPSTKITGANLTEATSSVLTITGGTGSVLSNVSIQVKLATGSQGGYLSSSDWTTFNGKLTSALTTAYIFVGSAGNVATGVPITGDIGITNAGVVSITANSIVNADINSSAAIAQSKMLALTPALIMATDGSGFATTVTGLTTTIAGFLTNISSDVQAQFAGKLSVTLTAPTNGDIITFNGSAWVNSPSSTGVPVGGTAGQFLNKINGTNYNTQWSTLTTSLITDLTSTVTELNQFTGVTTTGAQYQFLNTLTSNVQTQFTNKLDRSLPNNAIFVGNASNVPSALAAGTEGYVLTISSGAPTWSIITGTGTVTSVDVSGGTTGLTTSGGPVSTTGTITIAGTLIAANGGTGIASYAIGDILQASASTTLSKLASVATGNVLISGGVTTVSSWGKVGLTTHVSGNLPITNLNSGTNASSTTFWCGDSSWKSVVDNDATLAADSATVAPSQSAINTRFGNKSSTHYNSGYAVGVFQAAASGNMNVGVLSDGDSITIIANITGKDDSSNTGFGGQYITVWTKSGGVMNFVSESGALLLTDTGGTVTMSSSDGGGGQVNITLTIGGGTGNSSWFIKANYTQFVA